MSYRWRGSLEQKRAGEKDRLSRSQLEDTAQAFLDRAQIDRGECAGGSGEAAFVDGAGLIADRDAALAGRRCGNHDRRTRLRPGRQRYDHDSAPGLIQRIGGDNDRRPHLADFAVVDDVEVDPPDLAAADAHAFHRWWRGHQPLAPSPDGTATPSATVAGSHSAISAIS